MKIKGFTIIELLVTITIIALLSTIGMTGYQSVSRGGRDALRKSDLEQIRSALEIYKSENNAYPGSSTDCIPDNLEPDYINPLPADPKPANYSYCYNPTSSLTYEICAHLENGDGSAELCAGQCGGNCNFKVNNP